MKKGLQLLLALSFLVGFGSVETAEAQDLHFSQIDGSPIVMNPAYAGVLPDDDFRFTNQFRRQWNRVTNPYRTIAIAYDMAFMNRYRRKPTKGFWGGGISIVSDREGAIKLGTTKVDLYGSGSVYMGEYSTLSLGLSGGRHSRRLDFSNLTWDSQYNGFTFDQTLATGEAKTGLKTGWWDVDAGILWNYVRPQGGAFDVGISYQHVTSPDISFEGYSGDVLPSRLIVHHKSMIPIIEDDYRDNFIVPRAYFAMQSGHMEIMAGATYKIMTQGPSHYTGLLRHISFEFGGMYRVNDGAILLTRIEKENYSIGLSYDITTSALSDANNRRGGIEISFGYIGDFGGSKRVPRTM